LTKNITENDHCLANFLAPCGSIIKHAGHPTSVDLELLSTIDVIFFPPGAISPINPKRARHVAAGLHRLSEWRAFLDTLACIRICQRPR
jgi:hypothetical protein